VTGLPGVSESPRWHGWAAVAVLLVTLLGGWLWGASGRWELVRALETAETRRNLSEARAALLGARVSLDEADMAGVKRQLADALGFVGRASAGPPVADDDGWRQELASVLGGIHEAQRLVAEAAIQTHRVPAGQGPPRLAAATAADTSSISPTTGRLISITSDGTRRARR
jgi:hypothetical protein